MSNILHWFVKRAGLIHSKPERFDAGLSNWSWRFAALHVVGATKSALPTLQIDVGLRESMNPDFRLFNRCLLLLTFFHELLLFTINLLVRSFTSEKDGSHICVQTASCNKTEVNKKIQKALWPEKIASCPLPNKNRITFC